MNDAESLRDYLIADEILRIRSLSPAEARSELIELRSRSIEAMGLIEMIRLKQKTDVDWF